MPGRTLAHVRADGPSDYMRRYMAGCDEYSPAPVRRRDVGVCPVCLEEAELTWTGRMGLHPRPDGSGWCSSVGRKPVSVLEVPTS